MYIFCTLVKIRLVNPLLYNLILILLKYSKRLYFINENFTHPFKLNQSMSDRELDIAPRSSLDPRETSGVPR